MIKSYKYRLYPTSKQEKVLISTLTTCRFLYNNSLAERIDKYKEDKISVSYVDQANNLSENKNDYQKRVHSQVLQETLKRLEKSFKNFFRRVKNHDKKVGFPRFKSDNRFNSFCFPQSGFRLTNDNKRIELSKIGDIKIKYHRELSSEPKTCIIMRDIDQWFVILTCEEDRKDIERSQNQQVGIDVGIKTFLTLSNGETVDNPRTLIKSGERLEREQRILSKRVKGSENRAKQRIIVARRHRKIRNQRSDFLHKISTELVEKYGIIVFENLNIKGMVKNHKLAKHISDASWNKLIQMTSYKAEYAGCEVVLVDPRNTSQNCSACGKKVSKTLRERTHICPHCGLVMDRDLNASINIKNRAGTAQIDACGECVRPDVKSGNTRRNKKLHPLWVG
jgi:putative transposase